MTNIIPISYQPGLTQIQTGAVKPKDTSSNPFAEMLKDAVTNFENLDAVKNQDAIDLSLGNVDDIGQIQVNAEKAEVALQMFVEMRNKMLDAYNEVMRMNV